MAQQTVTGILGIAIPGDDSHNSPYGVGDAILASAVNELESVIITALQSRLISSRLILALRTPISPSSLRCHPSRLAFVC